jgi:hypothetical protein
MTQLVQITQRDLEEIHELQRDISEKQKRLEDVQGYVKTLLIAKTPIELGRFDARLSYKTTHHPAWKQAVIDELGAEYARFLWRNSTTSVFCQLLVEEHAIPPLWKASSAVPESEDRDASTPR